MSNMMRMHWALAGAGAMCAQAALLAGSPTIAQIAPPDAIAVFGVDDFASAREVFDASFLGALWRDQEMQDWFDRLLDEGGMADDFADSDLGEMLENALDRAGMERDELAMPSGAVGAALWWGENPDIEDIGLRWVTVCDFGDVGEDMRAMVESMIEVIGEEESLEVIDDDYEGADVWEIKLVEEDEGHHGGIPDDAHHEGLEDWEEDWEFDDSPALDHAHVAWIDNTLVIAGDRGALERAVNRINGEEMETLADSGAFADVQRQNQGAQAYAAGFIAPMLDAWIPDEAMVGFSLDPMLDALGIADIRSVSAGVRFDGPGGAIEQTIGVAVSEKKGLLALWDTKMDSFTPPSMVGADANAVYMFSFDWSGVMPLINRVIESIPDENARMQAQFGLGMFAGGVGPLLDGMRSEGVIVETIQRPFAPDSEKVVAAFGVRDQEAITAGITAMSPMLGFEPRDFLGNQIWESEVGATLGLGFGRIFVGAGEQVEDAMRQAGQAGAAGLADDPAFRKATGMLRGGGVLYTYQRNREAYEYALWTMANFDSILRTQLEEMELDEETIEMIIEDEIGDNPLEEIGLPSAELVFRYLGDAVVTEIHSTDDGFRGRTLMFPAADQD